MALPQSLSCTPPRVPNELVELARALKWNPDLIYEYVHNNIKTIPTSDSLKGAFGTLIDGEGTSVDQAELMFVLLQQSCFSPRYVTGRINLTATQVNEWLGADASYVTDGSGNVHSETGTVRVGNGLNPLFYQLGSSFFSVDLAWVWVSVPIGGSSYQFDPASKIFNGNDGYNPRSSGIANLGSTALQYSQSAFLNEKRLPYLQACHARRPRPRMRLSSWHAR
jgi:hypothetical protein